MTRRTFADRVEAEARRLMAIALSFGADPATAEDIVQEACLRAWDRRFELREPARLGAWLAQVVRNQCRDRLRVTGRRREGSLEALADAGREPVARSHVGTDPEALLRAMVTELPERYREVFALRYGAEMRPAEIAAFLDVSVATVETRLSRARKVLAVRMGRVEARAEAQAMSGGRT